MNFIKKTLTFCLSLLFTVTFSQKTKTYTTFLKDYNHALEMYHDKSYVASKQLFKAIKTDFDNSSELRANCEFYIANCAIRSGERNGDDLMLSFVKKHPTSKKQHSAFIDTADYYFRVGKYAYALKWYGKVETYNLTNYQKETYNFNYGYSLFASKNYTKSKNYFSKLLDSPKYGSQAKYYYGYIAYSSDDYETADQYFGQVVTDEKYANKVSYYLAEMNFKLGEFKKAIELGEPLLGNTKREEHSQLSKIIGESNFNLEDYSEAILHLKNYKGTRGKWNNTDYYLLGYAYYKLNDFENAIAHFNKIIGGKNAVAQNAYYHLGQCYLNQNKKSEALNAFRNSSQMDFDLKLQEDAYLNYAKLSYEIGNPYKNVPEVLQDFLNQFPKTKSKTEIEGLIVSAFLTSQDYIGALAYLENNKDTNGQLLYQKAAFYQAISKFNESEYQEAILFFEKALSKSINLAITAKSFFWNGEANFRLHNFEEALIGYSKFLSNPTAKDHKEFLAIHYNIAYAHFNRKEYQSAANSFQAYIDQNPIDTFKLNDSYSRMADTYFVSSDYQNAINTYAKIVKNKASDADYAQFQKAISYGFIRQDKRKIEELVIFIQNYPKSTYQDDAYYMLGNEYVDANNFSKAIEKYNYLIGNFRHSPLVSKAMLKKSVIYYNTERNEEALRTYKSVVKQFPNTLEAKQAVASARQIYVDLGRVDEYADWVKKIDFIEVTDAELDNDTFESAEKQYILSNHKRAISGFNKYIKSFPKGLHSVEANFYLAESLHSENEFPETIPHYTFVVEQGQNEFTEQSLYKLSLVYLKNVDYTNALPILVRLELESSNPQNKLFAQSNLMKTYYEKENYTKAAAYAEQILDQPKIDNNIESDAQVIIARSAIKIDDLEKAKKAYEVVEEIATGKLKAESLYYKAYFIHLDGKHNQSNDIIQKIASNFSKFKFWGAKALILMAKNHYKLKDAFQASYILESVIKNFPQYEYIVEEATKELNLIKTQEAKTNDSVKPGN